MKKTKKIRIALFAQIASIAVVIAIAALGVTACGGDDDNTGGTHEHSYSTTWSSNATQHWKECTGADCDAKTQTANHAPADGICTTCQYDNTPAQTKTVTVGTQNGTLNAGTAGTVTYSVTTANIANGTYPVTVANLPSGVTVGNSGNVTISGNSGTLTLAASTSATAATTSNLTLTLNGATSGTFSITILGKTVSVGAQVGTLTEKTAGTVTYPVTQQTSLTAHIGQQ